MEENLNSSVAPSVSMSTIKASDGTKIDVKQLNNDISWFKSDISMLMERVFKIDDERRREKEEKDEREYEFRNLRQEVEQLNNMFNSCFAKLCDVQKFVGEMAKEYVDEYTAVKVE